MFKSNTPSESITRSYIAAFVRVFVLAAFLVTAIQSSALAMTVTCINETGQTIVTFYHRPTNTQSWNSGSVNIPNGGTYYVNCEKYTERYIDLQFRLADGTYRERTSIDTWGDNVTL